VRRRRPLDVWPSYADLMTVLAVLGLFIGTGLLRQDRTSVDRQERFIRTLARQNESLRQQLGELAARHLQDQSRLARQAREVARNQGMFKAIQEAQRQIDEISTHSGLRFSVDQSLEFGDDLVTFETNSVEPIWRTGGRTQLRDFCLAVSGALAHQRGAATQGREAVESMFDIEVEGHTDSSTCSDDPSCNWRISSGRAASFVAVMRQSGFCPGGEAWSVRSVGYAETRPPGPGLPPTRRIAVRLRPDYGRIITTFQSLASN
jgi:flagellar motor protein MotB